MEKQEFRARLDFLHKNPPPFCDWRTFLTAKEPLPKEEEAAMDEYFGKRFMGNVENCPGCEKRLPRTMLEAFAHTLTGATSITWGLAHGEAYCLTCRWPYRGKHYKIGPIESLDIMLPYHPSGLSLPEEAETHQETHEDP